MSSNNGWPNKSAPVTDAVFLRRTFDDTDENGELTPFPLVEPPASLSSKLYDIAQPSQKPTPSFWYRPIGIAASLILAVLLSSHYYAGYQKKQVALQAKSDLATAFFYLQQANQIASAKLNETLADNIGEATLKPLLRPIRRDNDEKI